MANALRRTLRTGADAVVPRVSDLAAVVASTQGKIEIEAMEEGREHEVVAQLVAASVLLVFREHVVLEDAAEIVGTFDDEVVVHVGDDLAAHDYAEVLEALPALEPATRQIAGEDAGDEEMAAAARVPARGAAPHQAPEQGRLRAPRAVPPTTAVRCPRGTATGASTARATTTSSTPRPSSRR